MTYLKTLPICIRQADIDCELSVAFFLRDDLATAVKPGESGAVRNVEFDRMNGVAGAQAIRGLALERVDPFAAQGRYDDDVIAPIGLSTQCRSHIGVKQVYLVPNLDDRRPLSWLNADLLQHLCHVVRLGLAIRMSDVPHMEDQISSGHFLQCRPERSDELGWKVRNKAHGV